MAGRAVQVVSAGTRAAVVVASGVWFWQGMWAKILRRRPEQEAVLATFPGIGYSRARAATIAIGAGEVALGTWVLTRRAPVAAAGVQTGAVVAMGVSGALLARGGSPRPLALVSRYAGFLVPIWIAARHATVR